MKLLAEKLGGGLVPDKLPVDEEEDVVRAEVAAVSASAPPLTGFVPPQAAVLTNGSGRRSSSHRSSDYGDGDDVSTTGRQPKHFTRRTLTYKNTC